LRRPEQSSELICGNVIDSEMPAGKANFSMR
jgi:hypothetical protein